MYMSFFYIITIIESMIDTVSTRDNIKNVISKGITGGAKKPIKSSKSPKKSIKNSKSPKKPVKSSKSPKKPVKKTIKQPIGYIWKMSNTNGIITRETHPIYNMTEAKKMMYDKMHKIFNF